MDEQRYQEIARAAEAAGNTATGANLWTKAASLAEAAGDKSAQIDFLLTATLIWANIGHYSRIFAPFMRLEEFRHTEPDQWSLEQLEQHGWNFRYIIAAGLSLPAIPLPQLYALLEEMRKFHRQLGSDDRLYWELKYRLAVEFGSEEDAEAAFARFQACPVDPLSSCLLCDNETAVMHLLRAQKFEQAIELGEQLLAMPDATCAAQPESMLAVLMEAYGITGQDAQALKAHLRSYQKIQADATNLDAVSSHLNFLAYSARAGYPGRLSRGLLLLQRHLPWLAQAGSPLSIMNVCHSAAVLLDTSKLTDLMAHSDDPLDQLSDDQELQVRLPAELPFLAKTPPVPAQLTVKAVREWLLTVAFAAARLADSRPGLPRAIYVPELESRNERSYPAAPADLYPEAAPVISAGGFEESSSKAAGTTISRRLRQVFPGQDWLAEAVKNARVGLRATPERLLTVVTSKQDLGLAARLLRQQILQTPEVAGRLKVQFPQLQLAARQATAQLALNRHINLYFDWPELTSSQLPQGADPTPGPHQELWAQLFNPKLKPLRAECSLQAETLAAALAAAKGQKDGLNLLLDWLEHHARDYRHPENAVAFAQLAAALGLSWESTLAAKASLYHNAQVPWLELTASWAETNLLAFLAPEVVKDFCASIVKKITVDLDVDIAKVVVQLLVRGSKDAAHTLSCLFELCGPLVDLVMPQQSMELLQQLPPTFVAGITDPLIQAAAKFYLAHLHLLTILQFVDVPDDVATEALHQTNAAAAGFLQLRLAGMPSAELAAESIAYSNLAQVLRLRQGLITDNQDSLDLRKELAGELLAKDKQHAVLYALNQDQLLLLRMGMPRDEAIALVKDFWGRIVPSGMSKFPAHRFWGIALALPSNFEF